LFWEYHAIHHTIPWATLTVGAGGIPLLHGLHHVFENKIDLSAALIVIPYSSLESMSKMFKVFQIFSD
jgi:hypothetical protein